MIFLNKCQDHSMEKKNLTVLGKMDIHMQKNKVGSLPRIIFNNLLKINQRPKHKFKSYATIR